MEEGVDEQGRGDQAQSNEIIRDGHESRWARHQVKEDGVMQIFKKIVQTSKQRFQGPTGSESASQLFDIRKLTYVRSDCTIILAVISEALDGQGIDFKPTAV